MKFSKKRVIFLVLSKLNRFIFYLNLKLKIKLNQINSSNDLETRGMRFNYGRLSNITPSKL
jgi:hypothetical protein